MPTPPARQPTPAQRRAGGHYSAAETIKRWIAWRVLPRFLLDRAPRATYVGNNRVLVSTMVGRHEMMYYVEADDRLLSPGFIATGRFETQLTNYFLRNLTPDSHCLDIGSNFGFYSCLMAKICSRGRVLGVEADARIAELARDNLFINDVHHRANILPMAASDREGDLTLYRRGFRSGNTSIVQMNEGFTTALGEPPAEAFTVTSTRIDALADRLEGKVDFMKIDVEGAEPLVLAGAQETIRRNRDIAVVMEWSTGQIAGAGFDVAQFAQSFAAHGLHAFTLGRYDEQPIAIEALPTLPYQAGILLRRADRG